MGKRFVALSLGAGVTALLLGSSLGAQEKKITTVDFDAYSIMGQTKRPGAAYLFERRHGDLESLIKVRQNYRSEIKSSIHE